MSNKEVLGLVKMTRDGVISFEQLADRLKENGVSVERFKSIIFWDCVRYAIKTAIVLVVFYLYMGIWTFFVLRK